MTITYDAQYVEVMCQYTLKQVKKEVTKSAALEKKFCTAKDIEYIFCVDSNRLDRWAKEGKITKIRLEPRKKRSSVVYSINEINRVMQQLAAGIEEKE